MNLNIFYLSLIIIFCSIKASFLRAEDVYQRPTRENILHLYPRFNNGKSNEEIKKKISKLYIGNQKEEDYLIKLKKENKNKEENKGL